VLVEVVGVGFLTGIDAVMGVFQDSEGSVRRQALPASIKKGQRCRSRRPLTKEESVEGIEGKKRKKAAL
jgi:hypothetical protein